MTSMFSFLERDSGPRVSVEQTVQAERKRTGFQQQAASKTCSAPRQAAPGVPTAPPPVCHFTFGDAERRAVSTPFL